MANNIAAGPNAVVAKTAANLSDILNTNNTEIIYEVGNPLKSYVPGRAINAFTALTAGKGYYLVAKTAFDLETYVIPPIPAGGGGSQTVLFEHNFANGAGPFTLVPNGGVAEIVGGKLRLAGNGIIAHAYADGNFTPGTDNIKLSVLGVDVVKGIADVRISNNSYSVVAENLADGDNIYNLITTIGNAGVQGPWTTGHKIVYLQCTGTDDEVTVTNIKIEKTN